MAVGDALHRGGADAGFGLGDDGHGVGGQVCGVLVALGEVLQEEGTVFGVVVAGGGGDDEPEFRS